MKWLAVLLAGCSFSAKGSHAGDDGGGNGATTLVDDTAADFSAGTRTDLAVDSLGLLVPEAYIAGLHARSYANINIDDNSTFETLNLPAMIGERYGASPTEDWGYNRPYSLGLTSGSDYFTVLYDGEIYLAGPTTLQLAADDIGFLQVDLGADKPYLRAHYNDAAQPTLALMPAAAGWYPIRGIVVETYGSAKFQISTTTGPATFRTRVTDAQGVTVVGSQDRIFTHPISAPSLEPQLLDRTWNGTVPSYDLENIQNNDHSLRYAGQLRVDADSDVTFTLDEGGASQHYARLFIDGTRVAASWPGDPMKPTSDPVHLLAGWHDVVADFAMYSGNERVHLTANGAPLDAMHLRPVRTGGLLAYSVGPSANLGTNATTTTTYTLPVPAGATIDSLDNGMYLQNATRDQLAVTLAGTALTVPATATYEGNFDYWPELPPTSTATVMETVATMNTNVNLSYPALVASYHGGDDAPFAKAMTYVSAPHAAGGTITAVRVIGDLHGAQLTVEVRTGDTGTIDTAPWVAPETMPAGALVEYRLTLTSDGWSSPSIDRVEIDVTR